MKKVENQRDKYLEDITRAISSPGILWKVSSVTSSNVTTGTEYAANYRFDNGSIAMIHTDAGYYTPVPPPSGSGNPTYMHVWYLKDHLGNNRVLADGTGTALRNHHYDPFGESITLTGAAASPFPTGATESPYKYGGKEWDSTTSTYDFEARQFSPNFHRFTTMDPLCEKYYGISPYAYCANNPVNLVDPEGSALHVAAGAFGGAVSGAIMGATTTATFGASIAWGAIGEGVGSAIEQAIVDHESITIKKIANDALSGAIGGVVTRGAGKLVLDKAKRQAISSVDTKYATEAVKEKLTKEVKKDVSNSGQVLGKKGKQMVKKELDKRISHYSAVDKAMIETVEFVTQQEVGNTASLGAESLIEFLYDKREQH